MQIAIASEQSSVNPEETRITTTYVHMIRKSLGALDSIAYEPGKVVQVGTPWDIYYRQETRSVADFVGIAISFVER